MKSAQSEYKIHNWTEWRQSDLVLCWCANCERKKKGRQGIWHRYSTAQWRSQHSCDPRSTRGTHSTKEPVLREWSESGPNIFSAERPKSLQLRHWHCCIVRQMWVTEYRASPVVWTRRVDGNINLYRTKDLDILAEWNITCYSNKRGAPQDRNLLVRYSKAYSVGLVQWSTLCKPEGRTRCSFLKPAVVNFSFVIVWVTPSHRVVHQLVQRRLPSKNLKRSHGKTCYTFTCSTVLHSTVIKHK